MYFTDLTAYDAALITYINVLFCTFMELSSVSVHILYEKLQIQLIFEKKKTWKLSPPELPQDRYL